MISLEQYTRVLRRLSALEEHMNDTSVAMDKFITLEQIQDLVILLESSVAALEEQVNSLENRVSVLEKESWK